jgi:hypothetical protein
MWVQSIGEGDLISAIKHLTYPVGVPVKLKIQQMKVEYRTKLVEMLFREVTPMNCSCHTENSLR